MLAAASAKKYANSNFSHAISVWLSACFASIAVVVPCGVEQELCTTFGGSLLTKSCVQSRTVQFEIRTFFSTTRLDLGPPGSREQIT